MKKNLHITILLIGLISCPNLFGQLINLIPNASFEDTTGCNYGYNFPYLKDWYNPTFIGGIATATPDYYNRCTDPLNYHADTMFRRHSGYGRVGALVKTSDNSNIREYIAVKLKSGLIAGKNYCFDMHTTSFLLSKNGTDNLGVYFGVGAQYYNINTIPPVTPQINLPSGEIIDYSWHKLEAIYTAVGNETDIMIGGFKTDANAASVFLNDTTFFTWPSVGYYLNVDRFYNVFDDVSLHEMSINSGDTAVTCPQNMIATIGEVNTDTAFKSYWWYDASGALIDSINSQIQVQPTNNTFYIQEKRMCGQSLWDTIFVKIDTVCPPPPTEPPVVETEFVIPNVFSPNGDGINDVWRVSTALDMTIENFVIYNRWGISIVDSENINTLGLAKIASWDGYTTSGIKCEDGVYYYVMEIKNNKGEIEKFGT
ncbi:MAG: gliding motility-associated C-terminal domain-containing protein [Bacteroidetes bacterium]|nr:gliding motility-associated C-terminal domain-containing protein [Bacteroidota bacterium]